MRGLLIPALCLPLAACDGLEILAGNESPAKVYLEQSGALEVAVASMLSVTPPCVVTFRVNRCDEQGNETEWYYE
jgi:hypothetical protein